MLKKPGRNDPCSCGSGKKFKKCCESKGFAARFKVHSVGVESAGIIQKAVGLNSLFQSCLAATPVKPMHAELEAPLPESAQENQSGLEEKVDNLLS